MKIRYGAWVDLPETSTREVAQIREAKYDANSLYLFTVSYNNDKRALEDPMIEIFISAPKKDIFRIEARHFSGSRKKMPKFDLNLENLPIEVCENGDSLTVTNGKMRLEIKKNPAEFDFYYENRYLTSFAKKWERSYISHVTKHGESYMDAHLSVDIGEKLYGLGERFTPLVKNGQSVDIWNEDGGTCTEIAYKNIPFYLSSKGYVVFVNDPGPVSFELCSIGSRGAIFENAFSSLSKSISRFLGEIISTKNVSSANSHSILYALNSSASSLPVYPLFAAFTVSFSGSEGSVTNPFSFRTAFSSSTLLTHAESFSLYPSARYLLQRSSDCSIG